MARFSFPKQARLLHERDFRRVYRTGRRLRAFPLRFCAARLPEGRSRLGLAVSRKVGSAVVRNRWKRAVREAFRLNRHRLHAAYDLVVSVSWDTSPQDVRLVPSSFDRMVEALNASVAEDDQ